MDNLRRRFVINDHLGRHVKALKDLHEVGDAVFPEIEKYVVKNALYTEGLELYRYDLDKLKVFQTLALNAIVHIKGTNSVLELDRAVCCVSYSGEPSSGGRLR